MKAKVQLWVAGVLIGVFVGWVFFALILPWLERTLSAPSLGVLSAVCLVGASRSREDAPGGAAC